MMKTSHPHLLKATERPALPPKDVRIHPHKRKRLSPHFRKRAWKFYPKFRLSRRKRWIKRISQQHIFMVLRQATYWHRSKAKIQNRTGIQQPGRRQGWRNHKLQWCSGQLLWNHSGDKTGASQKQNYPLRAKTLVPAGQSGNFRPDPALVESFFRKSKRREDIFANQTGRDSANWIAKEKAESSLHYFYEQRRRFFKSLYRLFVNRAKCFYHKDFAT